MLATREQQWAWDLRGAWAGGWEVAVVLEEECAPSRLRGYVIQVATSGAFAVLETKEESYHVPCAAILTVRRPHFHEDCAARRPAHLRPQRREPIPGQLPLFEENRS